jgi:hypothetical protein
MCCFSAEYAVFRRKSKDWLARNQGNVSKWGDMSFRGQHEPYNKPTLLVDFILLNFIFSLVLAAKGLKLTGHLSLLLSILN